MNPSPQQIIERYIAIDAHKHYTHIVHGGTPRPIAPVEKVLSLESEP